MAAPVRRRKMIGHRRRVEDEGEDEGGIDHVDADDDSLTDGSVVSDDHDLADDSDTSNVDEASPTTPTIRKPNGRVANGNGTTKRPYTSDNPGTSTDIPTKPNHTSVNDTEFMLNGLTIADTAEPVKELNFEEEVTEPSSKTSAPIIVSSNSAATTIKSDQGIPGERRRKDHGDYRRQKEENPAFVPNRGAFFMHDHRHAGPSANGFRPFGRGGRGRGRGGIGGPFAPMSQPLHNPVDPTTSAPWVHDMHDSVAQPLPARQPRHHSFVDDGPPNGDGFIPTCPNSSTPINRHMATEKVLGTVQVRVFIPSVKEPVVFSGVSIKQYTKLPDHRPPLRRDKPVRISLPDLPPRFRFPAEDRSFIFIPRALRPNQQRLRGKPRSGLGSLGGFSRRTSVFGGSYYGGSAYSPSIAMSRRSSIVVDIGRDFIVSPSGSGISRPPLPLDASRPVVRLPPQSRPEQQMPVIDGVVTEQPPDAMQSTINDIPQPQTHPLPQKPTHQENHAYASVPMQQPRPQKTLSVADIEPPALQQTLSQPYQQAFHQQVPVQVSNGLGQDAHARHSSYASQHSTGTPLSQIPERAIHAAPFQPQPAQYPQQPYYPPYQMNLAPPQGYYYPQPNYPSTVAPSAAAPAFVPGVQQGQPQSESPASQPSGQSQPGSNLVAQEINGMVYYFDAAQIQPMTNYPPYPTPQNYPMAGSMNGMVTPNQEGYYYPPPAPGVVYYPQ